MSWPSAGWGSASRAPPTCNRLTAAFVVLSLLLLLSATLVRGFVLRDLVADDSRLTYDPHRGSSVVVDGAGYDAGGGADVSASATVFGGLLAVGQSREVVADVLGRDLGAALVLLVVLVTLAGGTLAAADVVERGTGAARIVFLGPGGGHLRVRVTTEGTGRADPLGDDPSQAVVALFPRR